MKISVQSSQDRDAIGLFNALSQRHETTWWDPAKHDIKELKPDVVLFTDSSKIGYKVLGSVQRAVNVFLKCDCPQECKAEKKFVFESLPTLADTVLLPLSFYRKQYAVDVFYLTNYPLENESQFQALNLIDPVTHGFTYRAAGNLPLPQLSYIGHVMTPDEASALCRSASICLDFGWKNAVDMLKIGCRVITDTENKLGVPVFNAGNINEVIKETLAQPRPVLNKYEEHILSYTQFLGSMSKLVGVEL